MRLVRRLKRIFARDQKAVFLTGFIIGIVLAVTVFQYQNKAQIHGQLSENSDEGVREYDFAYEKWLQAQGLISVPRDPDKNRYNRSHTDENSLDPSTEAFYLYEQIKVACLVLPETEEGALSVRDTWGRHCSKTFFYSHKLKNESIPIEKVEAKSSFQVLCEALRNIFYQSEEEFKWILVAPQDTFVLLENFRYFVAPKNSSEPHYLGHAMQFWGEVYNWGNAGYTLSRGALKALLDQFSSSKACEAGGKYWKNEDWHLGKHLSKLRIQPQDTRDHLGRGRFNGYSFKKLLFPGAVSVFDRYWRDSLYLSKDGPHCCSNFAITFHGILSNSKMYQLEYIFQHLRPFYAGGKFGNVPPKTHGPKMLFLTEEEKKKDEALEKLFGGLGLDVTPKDIEKLMRNMS